MNKRTAVGLIVAGLLLAVLIAGIGTQGFQTEFDQPQEIPTFNTGTEEGIYDVATGELREDSLPYAIFETYGFVLIPLAILMFGAMVGGVVISKEEVEE